MEFLKSHLFKDFIKKIVAITFYTSINIYMYIYYLFKISFIIALKLRNSLPCI